MAENYWAKKIREEMPVVTRPEAPPQGPWWQWTNGVAPYVTRTVEDVPLPAQPLPPPAGPHCPGCDSANYADVTSGDPRALNKVYRCYDCGWPVRHSTSDLNSVQGGRTGTPARQISTMTVTDNQGRVRGTTDGGGGLQGNYQPQSIQAGRIT
jgi:hypothetical protein